MATSNDPIVIVGAARTPMGGIPGRFRIGGGERSRRRRDQGRSRARRHQALRRRQDDLRLRAARRTGTGAGAAGVHQGGIAARDRLHDGEQDVRLCDGGDDPRARRARREIGRRRRRGRDGEHDERAVPDAEGALRLPDGPPDVSRSHVPRRARGCVRQGPADGHVRRGMRDELRVHARGAGRIRDGVACARARRQPATARSHGRSRP